MLQEASWIEASTGNSEICVIKLKTTQIIDLIIHIIEMRSLLKWDLS